MTYTSEKLEKIDLIKNEISAFLVPNEQGEYFARYQGRLIHSVFQPVFSYRLKEQSYFGCEALFRLDEQGEQIPPLDFLMKIPRSERYFFDRLLRALHLRNFSQSEMSEKSIFLNVDPGTYFNESLLNSSFDLLNKRMIDIGINPSQVIFEFIETPSIDNIVLSKSMNKLKGFGIRIAVDDFGKAHSGLERVKILQPSIVKFDRSWLIEARENQEGVDRFLENTKHIQSLGSQVLVEGVEFEDDIKMVELIEPDFVQGFWYGKPKRIEI